MKSMWLLYLTLTILYPGFTFCMQDNEYEGFAKLFAEIKLQDTDPDEDWDAAIQELPESEKKRQLQEALDTLAKNSTIALQATTQKNRGTFIRDLVISFLKTHKDCSRQSVQHGITVARQNTERVRSFSRSISRIKSFEDHSADTNQNIELIKRLQDISYDQVIEVSDSK